MRLSTLVSTPPEVIHEAATVRSIDPVVVEKFVIDPSVLIM